MEKTQQEERIDKLALALKMTDKIHLKDAASMLNVSEMTVRRDLSGDSKTLILLGGYIVNNPRYLDTVSQYFISEQQDKQVEEKRHIAQVAATLIAEDDTVFFDCGTTIPILIAAIDENINFTAVCYSLNAFLALQNKPNCKVILCGGNYKPNNAIFTSLTRNNELDNIRPNKAFMSAAGIHLQKGVSCFNFDELIMKHQVIQASNQKILLVDESKFGEVRPAYIGSLALFNKVVTNKKPPQDFINYFEEQKIKVMY